jgi:hypothetical protein
MREILLASILFGGCTFTPGATAAEQPDAGSGSGSSDGGTIAAKCHVLDPTLRLCLDFEGALSPTTVDLSGGSHDATALAIQPMARSGQQAVALIKTSSIVVPETPDLDIAQTLSIEMWLSPTMKPSATTYPVQNAGQYALVFDQNGSVGCSIGGSVIDDPAKLTLNVWAHVACTYDGSTLKIYANGDLAECLPVNGTIPTDNTSGTGIGAGKFIGGLDDIHIYSRALTDSEICMQAGRTGCNTRCPVHGGGGG